MAMAIGIFDVKASVPPFLPTLFYSMGGGALATVRIDVLLIIVIIFLMVIQANLVLVCHLHHGSRMGGFIAAAWIAF